MQLDRVYNALLEKYPTLVRRKRDLFQQKNSMRIPQERPRKTGLKNWKV